VISWIVFTSLRFKSSIRSPPCQWVIAKSWESHTHRIDSTGKHSHPKRLYSTERSGQKTTHVCGVEILEPMDIVQLTRREKSLPSFPQIRKIKLLQDLCRMRSSDVGSDRNSLKKTENFFNDMTSAMSHQQDDVFVDNFLRLRSPLNSGETWCEWNWWRLMRWWTKSHTLSGILLSQDAASIVVCAIGLAWMSIPNMSYLPQDQELIVRPSDSFSSSDKSAEHLQHHSSMNDDE
jgi:hypothetical protein